MFTLLYFIIGLVFMVPLMLVVLLAPQAAAEEEITLGLAFFFPVIYALVGAIIAPIGCWIYNLCARLVGGLDVVIEERTG